MQQRFLKKLRLKGTGAQGRLSQQQPPPTGRTAHLLGATWRSLSMAGIAAPKASVPPKRYSSEPWWVMLWPNRAGLTRPVIGTMLHSPAEERNLGWNQLEVIGRQNKGINAWHCSS